MKIIDTTEIKATLALLAVLVFVACVAGLFFKGLPDTSRDILLVAIGAAITNVKEIYGFYFGSSLGSEQKTALLSSQPAEIKTGNTGQSGSARLPLLIGIFLICFALSGCAKKIPTTNFSDFKTRADRVTTAGGKIIKRTGPLVTAAVCMAQPEYCIAAKAAYKGAAIAIDAIEAAKAADDGLKMAALAEEFTRHIDEINAVLAATGQEKIDLTEFQTTVQELQTTK